MGVAERIKEDIREKGLKEYVIAQRAGIKREAFYKLLNGNKRFDVDYLPIIAKAIGEDPAKYLK